jgi:penicillin-insensitive murein endopeptidase
LKKIKLDGSAHKPMPGKSLGSPTDGVLVGGAHLNEAPYLRIVPYYAPGDARWGLEPLVAMIDHSARSIRKQFPDSVLSVGHLSKPGGGEIDRHASHESGRDADIAFYVRNQQGKPIYADHFVPFKGDGTAPSWPGAQFDDPRNWALVASFASESNAHVTHIFVATPLRERLLSYAQKIGAPLAVRTRASELMAQPKGSLPHDDHFHVRIGCPAGMDKCVEQPLPRKHHGALAHAHGLQDHGKAHAAVSHPPGHGAPPAKAAPHSEEKHEEKTEALVPSLAPIVPGLDSAVIPAPLGGPVTPIGGDPPPDPAAPIDDPDGILN